MPAILSADVVLSVRIPEWANTRIDELVAAGPRSLRKARLLREIIVLGLERYGQDVAQAQKPDTLVARREAEQDPPDARIREPSWAPRLRELHAQGLTNAEIAAASGWTPSNVRQKLFRLRLAANR